MRNPTPLLDRIESATVLYTGSIAVPEEIGKTLDERRRQLREMALRGLIYFDDGELENLDDRVVDGLILTLFRKVNDQFELNVDRVWKGDLPDRIDFTVTRSGSGSCSFNGAVVGAGLFFNARPNHAYSSCGTPRFVDMHLVRVIDAYFEMRARSEEPTELEIAISSTDAPATIEITGPHSVVAEVAAYCSKAADQGQHRSKSPVSILWPTEKSRKRATDQKRYVYWEGEKECRAFHLTHQIGRGEHVLGAAINNPVEGVEQPKMIFARSKRFKIR